MYYQTITSSTTLTDLGYKVSRSAHGHLSSLSTSQTEKDKTSNSKAFLSSGSFEGRISKLLLKTHQNPSINSTNIITALSSPDYKA
jgi:hypothetical protein